MSVLIFTLDLFCFTDIVFCRTWAKVDVPPFYLNLPTHVVAQPRLMKTVGQLKREREVQVEPNPDNLYTPIQREEKRFRPLRVPKSLQEKLPFKDKPKILAKLNAPKRIAVIKDPHEREVHTVSEWHASASYKLIMLLLRTAFNINNVSVFSYLFYRR
jgi:ribosome biogenesis protein BMS1